MSDIAEIIQKTVNEEVLPSVDKLSESQSFTPPKENIEAFWGAKAYLELAMSKESYNGPSQIEINSVEKKFLYHKKEGTLYRNMDDQGDTKVTLDDYWGGTLKLGRGSYRVDKRIYSTANYVDAVASVIEKTFKNYQGIQDNLMLKATCQNNLKDLVYHLAGFAWMANKLKDQGIVDQAINVASKYNEQKPEENSIIPL